MLSHILGPPKKPKNMAVAAAKISESYIVYPSTQPATILRVKNFGGQRTNWEGAVAPPGLHGYVPDFTADTLATQSHLAIFN